MADVIDPARILRSITSKSAMGNVPKYQGGDVHHVLTHSLFVNGGSVRNNELGKLAVLDVLP